MADSRNAIERRRRRGKCVVEPRRCPKLQVDADGGFKVLPTGSVPGWVVCSLDELVQGCCDCLCLIRRIKRGADRNRGCWAGTPSGHAQIGKYSAAEKDLNVLTRVLLGEFQQRRVFRIRKLHLEVVSGVCSGTVVVISTEAARSHERAYIEVVCRQRPFWSNRL